MPGDREKKKYKTPSTNQIESNTYNKNRFPSNLLSLWFSFRLWHVSGRHFIRYTNSKVIEGAQKNIDFYPNFYSSPENKQNKIEWLEKEKKSINIIETAQTAHTFGAYTSMERTAHFLWKSSSISKVLRNRIWMHTCVYIAHWKRYRMTWWNVQNKTTTHREKRRWNKIQEKKNCALKSWWVCGYGYLRSARLVISLKRITAICSFGENKIVSHHKAKITTTST